MPYLIIPFYSQDDFSGRDFLNLQQNKPQTEKEEGENLQPCEYENVHFLWI